MGRTAMGRQLALGRPGGWRARSLTRFCAPACSGSSAAIAGKDPGTARAHAVIAALEVEAAAQRIAQSGASAAMRCWPRSIMMRTPVVHSSGSKITKQESLEMAAYIQEHNQHSALEAHTQIYI